MAGLITIHEGGPTVPIGQYLAALYSQQAPAPSTAPPPSASDLPVAFPIETPSMQPGRLSTQVQLRTAGWLAAPMFIIGDDPLSRQWLTANRQRLQRLGASGLVVNAASAQAFRALRTLAPELPLAPGSIEELARQAHLTVYPLFVGVDGRVTQVPPHEHGTSR
jgi:integrating conjugative element protein (TIGR03765 family)